MNGTDCRAGLAALAAGRWDEWGGLAPDCTRAAAEEAIGPTAPEPDGSGALAGSPTAFRIYPPAAAAPHGIQLWLAGDRIVLVQINSPAPGRDPEAMLVTPEATLPSGLAPRHRQWVYASRGLTLHVHDRTHEVRRLYGYAPASADEFAQSWLARVELQRVARWGSRPARRSSWAGGGCAGFTSAASRGWCAPSRWRPGLAAAEGRSVPLVLALCALAVAVFLALAAAAIVLTGRERLSTTTTSGPCWRRAPWCSR